MANKKYQKKPYATTEIKVYPDLLHFKFKDIPPSENHAMLQRGWKKFPTQELKDWREYVKEAIPQVIILNYEPRIIDPTYSKNFKTPWLQAEIRIHMPLLNKTNGRVKRFDVHNRIKYLIDPVCERLVWTNGEPVDDKYFKRITATKIDRPREIFKHADKRFCEIIISPCPRLNDRLNYSGTYNPPQFVALRYWENPEDMPRAKRMPMYGKSKKKIGRYRITV